MVLILLLLLDQLLSQFKHVGFFQVSGFPKNSGPGCLGETS